MILNADGKPPSVMVAVPCFGQPAAPFMRDLTALTCCAVEWRSLADPQPLDRFSVRILTDTYLHTARMTLAEKAVEEGFDYVLWLDADMTFPAQTIQHLLSRGLPIVGANYCKRSWKNPTYVAIKKVNTDGDGPSRLCVTAPESEDVEEVDTIGLGCALTAVEVFRSIEKPWFFYEWLPEIGEQVGEDAWFCRAAREAGYTVHVDHDLSHHVGHVGEFVYDVGMAWHNLPEEDKKPFRTLEAV